VNWAKRVPDCLRCDTKSSLRSQNLHGQYPNLQPRTEPRGVKVCSPRKSSGSKTKPPYPRSARAVPRYWVRVVVRLDPPCALNRTRAKSRNAFFQVSSCHSMHFLKSNLAFRLRFDILHTKALFGRTCPFDSEAVFSRCSAALSKTKAKSGSI
jgi:hypothetical protein